MPLTIDPELHALIPPLSPDEYAQLEANLVTDGCRDPLVAWQGILLDGHNRHQICTRRSIAYRVKDIALPDRLAARVWIRWNQLGRRNLYDDQRAMQVAALLEDLTAQSKHERAKAGRRAGGRATAQQKADRLEATASSKRSEPLKERVRAKAAKRARVSERKVKRAMTVRKKAPDLANQVATGDLSLKDAERKIKERDREGAKAAALVAVAAVPVDQRFDIRVCDMATLLGSLRDVDAIITDPPYGEEAIPLYGKLAKAARSALSTTGVLAVMCGQFHLPAILAAMTPHLPYRWTLAYLTPGGQSPQIWPRKVNTFWKPVLVFGASEKWIGDVVKSDVNDNDKRFHQWGQSESGMARLVEMFTEPDALVCDPFLGGGTIGVVALALGRRFIGADVDAATMALAKTRMSKACP